MGGVLRCLIFSCLQNPMGYEFEQDHGQAIVQTV